MGWFAIFEAVLDLIERCQEKRDPAEIEAGLNNPGILEKLSLRAVIKKELGLSGKKLRKKVKQGMAELRDLDPSDIREIMEEVARRSK
jgi:hypothetical protein